MPPASSPMAASSISATRRIGLGQAGNFQNREQNRLHSVSVTDDGERVYVAGTTAGFYVLDSEAVAHATERAARRRHGRLQSALDDRVGRRRHRRVQAAGAGQRLPAHGRQQRSRTEGVSGVECVGRGEGRALSRAHHAVPLRRVSAGERVADRHAQRRLRPRPPGTVRGNTKGRPAYVWLSDENGGCPLNYARMVSVESEATPIMVGAFAIPDNQVDECLTQATTEPNGQPRRRIPQQNHNPTCSRTWSSPPGTATACARSTSRTRITPREVGHALTVPQGVARTYPVFKDGLIYWVDNDTGLHVAQLHRSARATNCLARAQAPMRAMPRARIGRSCATKNGARLAALALCAALGSAMRGGSPVVHRRRAALRPGATAVARAQAHVEPTRHGVRVPDASRLHARHRRHVPALRHGAGARRAVRRARLRARVRRPSRPSCRPGEPATLALPRLPSGHRRTDPEVRDCARAAVPPVRDQPGHDALSAHPPGAAGRTARGSIDVTLPKAGYYKVLSDFLPAGGSSQFLARPLVTAGYAGDLAGDCARLVAGHDLDQDRRRSHRARSATIRQPFVAGLYGHLQFSSDRHRDGQPVTDLQTYLGAFGHTLIMSEDMMDYVHSHPLDIVAAGNDDERAAFLIPPGADLEKLRGGPDVTFDGLMPKPGRYRAWTQFRRNDKVHTFATTFEVAAR